MQVNTQLWYFDQMWPMCMHKHYAFECDPVTIIDANYTPSAMLITLHMKQYTMRVHEMAKLLICGLLICMYFTPYGIVRSLTVRYWLPGASLKRGSEELRHATQALHLATFVASPAWCHTTPVLYYVSFASTHTCAEWKWVCVHNLYGGFSYQFYTTLPHFGKNTYMYPKLAVCLLLFCVSTVLIGLSACIHCSLGNNSIGENGAAALGPALQSLTSLQTLR